jgi:type VI secretion system protein VasG
MSKVQRIQRTNVAKRLGKVPFRALEQAFGFARLRGNAQVDLLHWIYQILDVSGSDFDLITRADSKLRASLDMAMLEELERLPKGAERVTDFSPQLDELMEASWVIASAHCAAPSVRSGHVMAALLRSSGTLRSLGAVGSAMRSWAVESVLEAIAGLSADALEASTAGESAPDVGDSKARGPAGGKGDDALSRYTQDITAAARDGRIDPVTGRDNEIRQIIDVLQRRRQNNPILTGEPGVGKTAVVEGLARAIVANDVPPPLRNVSLLALDLGALQAGASMKGEFEARLRSVIEAVQRSSTPIILFIDEAHTLIGAGGAAGTGDAANLLKPALARGTLRTIAATTWAEYKRYFEKDAALVRRFQVIPVEEPSQAAAIRMLHALRAEMELHHKVEILDEALRAAVDLSSRYMPSRQLPDKAISLLDTAAARVAVGLHTEPEPLVLARRSVEALELERSMIERRTKLGEHTQSLMDEVEDKLTQGRAHLGMVEGRWKEEASLATQISALRSELVQMEIGSSVGALGAERLQALRDSQARFEAIYGDGAPMVEPYVDANVVASVISDWTGIPLGRMIRDESETILNLGRLLTERVVGQEEGHRELADRIRVGKAGLQDPTRPIGVFLLAGPSGVGKTETALALADLLYGGEQNLISISMSEFQEAHTVSTLKGAPPGYVGYGEGGRLTEAVRRKPYSVVLLDEVEKAHPDVHEIFFQVFDKGQMEDSEGRRVDFRNCVILLTTNVGSDELIELVAAGGLADPSRAADVIMDPLRQTFPDALLGRMKVVPFMPLSLKAIQLIVERRLNDLAARARRNYGATLVFSDSLRGWVHERAKPTVFGARLVNAIVTDQVAPAVAEMVLSDRYSVDANLLVDVSDTGAITCTVGSEAS